MLADTLKDIRRKNYLNQTEFANRIGVTQSAISQWEHGLTRPNSDQLKAISLAFGISIDTLLAGEQTAQMDGCPKTVESRIISNGVDRMPPDDRKRALNILRSVYAEYFDNVEDKIG